MPWLTRIAIWWCTGTSNRATAQARERALGPLHQDTLENWVQVGTSQLLQRKFTEAEVTLRRTFDAYAQAKLETWQRYSCEASLGRSLAAQQRFGEAEPLLLAGYAGMRQREETIPAVSRRSLERAAEWIAQLYADEGRPSALKSGRNKSATAARPDSDQ